MLRRLLPALAGGAGITFLLLLALPLPAMHDDTPIKEETPQALPLSCDVPSPWDRTPSRQQVAPEEYALHHLEQRWEQPRQHTVHESAPELFTPVPAPMGMGLQPDISMPFSNSADASFSALAPGQADTMFELGQVDRAPQATRRTPPIYPQEARRKRLTGMVLLRFLVEQDGSVARVQVLEADPPGVFEESAVRAVQQWRFTPGERGGKAVRTWVRLPVRFRLEN